MSENTEQSETELSKVQEELEAIKKSQIKEMQMRGQRCAEEINAVMIKHNCGFSVDVQIVAKPL